MKQLVIRFCEGGTDPESPDAKEICPPLVADIDGVPDAVIRAVANNISASIPELHVSCPYPVGDNVAITVRTREAEESHLLKQVRLVGAVANDPFKRAELPSRLSQAA